jgi:polysaccharide transporter, PST family
MTASAAVRTRPVAFGVSAMLAERALRLLVGLGVTFLIARHLGVATFGLLSTAQAIVALTGPLVVLGLDQICVRELVVRPQERRALLGTTAALQLAGGAVAALICLIAALLLQTEIPGLLPFLAVLALLPLLQWPAAGEYALRANGRNPTIAGGRMAATFAYLALALVLLERDAPSLAFAWLAVADLALLGVVQLGFLVVARGASRLSASRTQAATLLRDSWPLVLAGLAVMVYMRTDQVMLAGMLGEDAVGIYTAAARISEAWYVVPTTVAYVLGPALLRHGDPQSTAYLHALFGSTRRLVQLTLVVAFGVSVGAHWIVVWIYGPAYAEAAPVLALHFWSAIFVALGVLQSLWLVARNRTRLSLYRTLLGAGVNVGLNLVLIPTYGAMGAAAATLIAQVCATFLSNLLMSETRQFFAWQVRTLLLLPVQPKFASTHANP